MPVSRPPTFRALDERPLETEARRDALRAWAEGREAPVPRGWAFDGDRAAAAVGALVRAAPASHLDALLDGLADAPLVDVAANRLVGLGEAIERVPVESAPLWPLLAACSPTQLRFVGRAPDALADPEGWAEEQTRTLDQCIADPHAAGAEDAVVDALRRRKRARLVRSVERECREPLAMEMHTAHVSAIANEAVRDALRFASARHGLEGAGIAVFGMGKLGSHELNLSSDIDLVFIHAGVADVAPAVRDVVQLLDRTAPDGRVFRVDLRLRPFGTQGAVAHTIGELVTYVETHGREWERTAWLKARAVAGDADVATEALRRIEGFRFPRSLDAARLEELAARKHQMVAAARRPTRGSRDLKVGPGGIREIEFFAQAFQLVFGGRDASLRGLPTVDVLRRLVVRGDLAEADADALVDAWRWLRCAEHRLQMEEERQTHALPSSGTAARSIALRLGFANERRMIDAFGAVAAEVQDVTGPLFAGGGAEPADAWVRKAVRSDEDEARALAADQGFANPAGFVRELARLTQTTPPLLGARASAADERGASLLLDACAGTPRPDTAARHAFDVLHRRSCRSALLPALRARAAAARVVASLFSAADELSSILARHPLLMESLLSPPALLGADEAGMYAALRERVDRAEPVGEQLPEEAARLALARFRVEVEAAAVLARVADVSTLTPLLRTCSALAGAVVRAVVEAAFDAVRSRAPEMAVERLSVVAMGKLGGSELGPGGDLDLVFVFDDENARVAQYARVVQRAVSALQSGTAYGRLYPVDLRLRPDGSQGAVVTSLAGFDAYYETRARPYERLALRRARAIGGSVEVQQQVDATIRKHGARLDLAAVRADVRELRARRLAEKDVSDDVKHREAGLLDLELALQVMHAEVAPRDAGGLGHHEAIDRLADAGRFDPQALLRWRAALGVYRDTEVWLRLAQGADASRWPAAEADRAAIRARVERTHHANFERLWEDATAAAHEALAQAGLQAV